MALHYQTECRLGTRRINRSYNGYQAFVAIVFDLFFGLLFELIATALSLTFRLLAFSIRLAFRILKASWKVLVAAMAALVFTLTLPFVLVHRAIARLAPPSRLWPRDEFAASTRKPDWALSREV
jgi:hypothetical protein